MIFRRAIRVATLISLTAVFSVVHARAPQGKAAPEGADRDTGWTAYGGGPEQTRYSSLAQINKGNVKQLQVAWTFDSGESGGLQTNPIVINGTLFTTTPSHKVVALDAATGVARWTFDSGMPGRGPNRGVTYWAEGNDARVFTAQGSYIYSLDPKQGCPIRNSGKTVASICARGSIVKRRFNRSR